MIALGYVLFNWTIPDLHYNNRIDFTKNNKLLISIFLMS